MGSVARSLQLRRDSSPASHASYGRHMTGCAVAKFKTYYEVCASFGGVRMPPLIWGESGVYCISCEPTGKQYIGCSKHIMKRLKSHFSDLNKGVHLNRHLQSSWNKYGASSFYVCVLHYTEDIKVSEIKWIAEFDSYNNGMNNTPGGDGGNTAPTGTVGREKILESLRTPEFRKKIGEWSKKFHEENKEDMRAVLKDNAIRGWAGVSPEERTARALRAWEKRRQNAAKCPK